MLPKVPFCTNVRPNAEMYIKPCSLYQLNKSNQIISSFKIELIKGEKKRKNRISLTVTPGYSENKKMNNGEKEVKALKYISRGRLVNIPEYVSVNAI